MTPSRLPEELRYTATHEWLRPDGDVVVVGITDHAQAELTDIVFVDLPKTLKDVAAAESVLVLESVKTVADVYAPVSGALVEVNAALQAKPGLVNVDPYGAGWLFKIRAKPGAATTPLLSATEYRGSIGEA
ncbi:MAG: glycine cleavage system protein GcvH [Thermoplasmata archaeon]|nr:glycine cleavage system protein GcvH [Thermoplasmata archaeon]